MTSFALERAGDTVPNGDVTARWRWWAASLVAGAVPVLVFPAPGLWWLAWVALVPWLLLVRRAPSVREAAIRGWCGGCGFLLAVHHWLLPSAGVFLVPAVAVLAVLWLPWAAVAWWLLSAPGNRARAAAAIVVVPAAWVAVEAVRSWSALGGPWGLLGASQWQVPALLAPASLGGVWLVSYLIVAVNVAVVAAIAAPRVRARSAAAATAGAIVAAGPMWFAVEPPPHGGARLPLAVVQPGVVHGPVKRLDRELQLTERLPPRRFGLVVWGESSVGFDLYARPDVAARLQQLAQRLRSDLLVNVDARDRAGRIHKAAVLVGTHGIVGQYDKMRLVPFGEYVPLRRLLGWMTTVTPAARQDRARGHRLVLLHADRVALAPLVCFESAFPDMSRRAAWIGAQVIVVQSSTSTFQGSWAPAQHASLAAVRAAETGRPVVHATLTGTSAAFDAQGRRLAWFDTHERGTLAVSVPLATRRTPYLRYGDWVLAWSFLVLAATGVAALTSAPTAPRRAVDASRRSAAVSRPSHPSAAARRRQPTTRR